MRAGLFTLSVLIATTSAVPRIHRPRHLRAHDKRADVTVVQVETDVVTATAAKVIVYVGNDGVPISTSYVGQEATQPAPMVKPSPHVDQGGWSAESAATPPAYQPSPNPPPAYNPPVGIPAASTPGGYIVASSTPDQQAAPAIQTPQFSAPSLTPPASPANSNGTIQSGRGVSYTPYNDDGTVKTQDQVTSDLAGIDGYSTVRIYDTNDNQVSMLIQAAKPKGMKVFVGFSDPNDVVSQVQAIIVDAKDDWNTIHTVAVGNEAVSRGLISRDGAVSAINTARGMLRAAGYTGPVVTVDNNPTLMMSDNKALCQSSDYTAANIHPWYSETTTAEEAGDFVSDQVRQIAANCGTDPSNVLVTETGWPWQGTAHGNGNRMVASPGDQDTAIRAIESQFSDNIIFFSAFDEPWKAPEQYNCEHYWGFLRHNS